MSESGFPGIDGFLGTRAPLMIDVVCLAMIGVVLVLGWSIYQVKIRSHYQLHKWTQVTLGAVLLVVVILFEVDIRLHGWEERAANAIGGGPPPNFFFAPFVHFLFFVSVLDLLSVTLRLAGT